MYTPSELTALTNTELANLASMVQYEQRQREQAKQRSLVEASAGKIKVGSVVRPNIAQTRPLARELYTVVKINPKNLVVESQKTGKRYTGKHGLWIVVEA